MEGWGGGRGEGLRASTCTRDVTQVHKNNSICSTHDQTLSEQYSVVLGGILVLRQPLKKAMSTVTALEGHVQ